MGKSGNFLDTCRIYTPRPLADAMVSSICRDRKQEWLEPSCGEGVFLESLSALGISKSTIVALDIDDKSSVNDGLADVQRGVDFLKWSENGIAKFDCIVGNPPFLSVLTLTEPFRSRAAQVKDIEGYPIGLKSNLWYAFLIRAYSLLKEGGNLAFILPAAAEFADYSNSGRKHLTGLFKRVDLIRSGKPLFENVQEGSVILICRDKGQTEGRFKKHYVEDLNELVREIPTLLNKPAKPCPSERKHNNNAEVRLGDIINIGLGGVTGDASYFLLTEDRRIELKLPRSSVKPVISRSSHVRTPIITHKEWKRIKEHGDRVWLFFPSEKDTQLPSVRKYLSLSAEKGGCIKDRYKIRTREPWYITPMPPRPDGFISGMSTSGPWFCLNDMKTLNATNTLYVIHFKEDLNRDERFRWGLALITSASAKSLSRITRIYADGLKKIEPGNLADIRIKRPPQIKEAEALYRKALKCLFSGNVDECRRIADGAMKTRQ